LTKVNHSNPPFNALIIGAGNIGAFFDTPNSEAILTHAHAYKNHQNFNLVGFIDKDPTKAKEAAKLWNCRSFNNLEEAFKEGSIDVVSVTAPDDYHYEILKNLSHLPLKLIFAEKPLAKTIKEAEEIVSIYQSKNIPVLVNYSRRFVNEFSSIKENIESGLYGKYIVGNGYYGKGILHNGSHMIDLLRFLIGEISDFNCLNKVNDFYPDDPSISAYLQFSNGSSFNLNAVDCRDFTIFEADFIFEKARIRMLNSGFVIEEYFVEDNKIFKGYKNLNLKNVINTSLSFALANSADNIAKHLTESQPLKCSLNDGYKALEVALKITVAL
jgi:predicted dehydrogenase